MDLTGTNLSADSVRAYIGAKKEKDAAEMRAHEAEQKAEREKLHEEFERREVQPEAMERIANLVRKAVEIGEKQVLVLRFPSDWLPDQGRAITNPDKNWHEKLDGFARRAHDFFKRELEPRGFQIRAEIVDWPGGMPGDVGFFLQWKRPEEM